MHPSPRSAARGGLVNTNAQSFNVVRILETTIAPAIDGVFHKYGCVHWKV